MLNIERILLPVDIPIASLDVIYQAAVLARHFKPEIVMPHIVTAKSHAAGVPADSPALAGWDLLGAVNREAKNQGESSIGSALEGLNIHGKLSQGDAAVTIVGTAIILLLTHPGFRLTMQWAATVGRSPVLSILATQDPPQTRLEQLANGLQRSATGILPVLEHNQDSHGTPPRCAAGFPLTALTEGLRA